MDAAAPSGPGSAQRKAAQPAAARTRRGRGYGFLLAGVVALALLDLVFALESGWGTLLLAGGVLLVAIGWVMRALLGWRSMLEVTAVVAVSYVVLVFSTQPLRTLSWWMLVRSHPEALHTVVAALAPVRMAGEARRIGPRCTQLPGVRPADCAPLRAAMKDVGAHGAWKEGEITVLETYAWINVRGGLLHCRRDCGDPPAREVPYPRYRTHVAGNWYRWAQ